MPGFEVGSPLDWAEDTAMPSAKGRSPEDDASRTIVTPKQMAGELADGQKLSKQQTEALLNDLMTLATRHIRDGDKIRLTGIGIL
jgi:DNA-binding protein HU-beta